MDFRIFGLSKHPNIRLSEHPNILLFIAAMLLPWTTVAQVNCDSGDPVTVSNADAATATSNYFPGYSLYNYSYTEQIVPADDLAGLSTIMAMMYNPTNTTSNTYFNNCEIYLANVSVSDLTGGFVQDMSLFELVYTGTMNWDTAGWQSIVFDTPFSWDGTSNLLVAIRRNHGSWSTNPFALINATPSKNAIFFQRNFFQRNYYVFQKKNGGGRNNCDLCWRRLIC